MHMERPQPRRKPATTKRATAQPADELDAVFGFEGADQIAEIGLVKFRDHLT